MVCSLRGIKTSPIRYMASIVKGLKVIKEERGCPSSPQGYIINLGNEKSDRYLEYSSGVPDCSGAKGVTYETVAISSLLPREKD